MRSGLYDLDIRAMDELTRKLNPIVYKPDPCFKTLSRDKMNQLQAKSLSVAPSSTTYEVKYEIRDRNFGAASIGT